MPNRRNMNKNSRWVAHALRNVCLLKGCFLISGIISTSSISSSPFAFSISCELGQFSVDASLLQVFVRVTLLPIPLWSNTEILSQFLIVTVLVLP
ncbi:hypothetical protein L596_001520 [Steinernema carpocapsae]|uniref:Uncharacterized protein n=1 Tax=Steinernema carpocapsae TaxID=34508 RepID=A0A4U8UMI2_STECR|nr:hypothetical protein L596_001520 [Steinernema carpocapsae]